MRKVLIMSIKAGYGHHSTAKAMIDYFNNLNIECQMLDCLEYVNGFLGDSVQDAYLFLTKYIPDIYGGVYDRMANNNKEKVASPWIVTAKMVAKKIREYVEEYNPDAIVGTHSYACVMMSHMKKKGYISCPTYGVITDFTVHPLWENTSLDYYITPDRLLNSQMVKKGIPEEKILPIGIPIKEKFSTKIEKSLARGQLGISDKTTILIMMGSMGFGNIEEDMEKIMSVDGDFQVLCVCGTNEKTKKTLEEREWEKDIFIYGFVDNVDVLMDASDCIITKPGGLTTSELMAKGLPAILVNPIPGQEDRNMEFLVNSGAGVMVTKTFPIDEALGLLMNNSWRMEFLSESVKHLGKPNSTRNLCEFIIERF